MVGDVFDGRPVAYELFHNTSVDLIQDLAEVFAQRLSEVDATGALARRKEVLWEVITGNVLAGSLVFPLVQAIPGLDPVASALTERSAQRRVQLMAALVRNPPTGVDYARHRRQLDANIAKGNRLVFFSHSQGSLYMNVAYDYARDAGMSGAIRAIHVGPASASVRGGYFLADFDVVINGLLRAVTGYAPAPNANIPAYVGALWYPYMAGHDLFSVYLNQQFAVRDAIRDELVTALGNVGVPAVCGEQACDLADDNNDGQVDEGHAWLASSWKPIFSVPQYPVYVRAVALSNGHVALVGGDSTGGGHDRGFVALTDETGRLLFEPAWTTIDSPGVAIAALAEGASGEIGALYSTTDYSSACRNCPVVFSRVDGSNGKLQGALPLSLSFRPRDAQGMAWNGSKYVGLVRDADTGALRVIWIEPVSGTVTNSPILPSDGVTSSSLALGPEGLGWVRGFSTGRIDFGVTSSDGATDVLRGPLNLVERDGVGVFGDGGGRGLVASGSDFIATFTRTRSGVAEPQIARLSGGSVANGPEVAGPSGFGTKDVLMVGTNPVTLTISPTQPYDVHLRRLKGNLTPLVPPVPDTVISSDSGYLTAAATSSGVLVFKGSYQLGGSVDVARVGCQ